LKKCNVAAKQIETEVVIQELAYDIGTIEEGSGKHTYALVAVSVDCKVVGADYD
jgi:hypothetical protein